MIEVWREYQATDGVALRALYLPAQGQLRGRLLLLHGIQSHAGWYGRSCQALAEAGYEVLFVNRRGSGNHTEDRGDIPGWRQVVADADAARRAVWGEASVVVVGISWGAKVALALAKCFPVGVEGVALWAPGLCPLVTVSGFEKMAIAWARLVAPARAFPIPLNDPALFTASPKWQEFLREDPWALHRATARLLVESTRLDIWLAWQRWDLPVLVQLAGAEQIVDNQRTRAWVDRRLRKKQVLEYAGAYHTLEFEPETIWRDHFLTWAGKIIPK